MRIGIAGSHGTGKTTLAEKLADVLELPLIHEVAREVAREMGLDDLNKLVNNYELARVFQGKILLRQLEKEMEYSQGFVSDRTVIDNLAYWYYYGLARQPDFNKILSRIRGLADSCYDVIFFVPVEFPVVYDGFRFVCEPCRNVIEGIIMNELMNLQETPVFVLRGSVEERLKKALEIIDKLEANWSDGGA